MLLDEDKIKNKGEDGTPVIQHGYKKNTGTWKIKMPIVDKKKCIKCKQCWLNCPEGAISMGKDGKPVIDYSICKGCLVCVEHCPVKAMTEKKVGCSLEEKNE